MSTLRWLSIAGATAGLYASHLIYAQITASPVLPPRLNTLVLITLGIGVAIPALAVILERIVVGRTKDIDHRLTIMENDLRSLINATATHFDIRLDSVGARLEENTGEIRAHVCPMLPADNVVSFELGRQAGRTAKT